MTPLEFLRNCAFWALDSIKGGKIRKYYRLLNTFEGNQERTDAQLQKYYNTQIAALLTHCVKTVPAYADLAHLLHESSPLDKWPVINKMTLKEGGDRYMSSLFDKNSLIPMTTSGSTGTPFTCWQNSDKKRHVNAEVLFYNGKIGYTIGRRIIYFRSIVNEVAKSRLQQFMQNIHLIDCGNLNDDGIRAKLKQIKDLSCHGGAMILSYASTLDAFARYFEKYGTSEAKDCKIYGIASGSEMLKDATRDALSRAFGCKVVSRYANEENGFIGQDENENNIFIHNRANYFIEILKFDSDKPVEPGEIGRIVITDLYNYAMPMVRYDTGDVGAWQEVRIGDVTRKAIGQFGGRRVDMIYDTLGRILSPYSITNYMWKHSERIKQFQFVQLAAGKYLIKINSSDTFDTENLLIDLKNIVGQDAQITVENCDEIPVLASGKRRYIVNLMNSNSK